MDVRRHSFARVILPFSGMMALLVVISGAVIYLAGQRAARAQQVEELSRLTKLVREQIGTRPDNISAAAAQLRDLAEVLATRITLIDANGAVTFDTDVDPLRMENHNDRPEVGDARRSGFGSAVRYSHTISEDAVYVAAPLDPKQPAGFVLRLSYPRHVWTLLPVPAWAVVLAGAIGTALLVGWLTLLLNRDWISPVRALSDAASLMASGRWDTRVVPRGADEVRLFSDTLNYLAGEAERQLAEVAARQSELQALVDALPDPVLLTDADQRVTLVNRPAARLLQLSAGKAVGQKLISVLNDEALIALFERASTGRATREGTEAQAAPTPTDVRITRNGQRSYYQAVAAPTRGGGVLLVLRNVTTMASAVQMKTDFVANASHELRTPIAAIKVAFETLEDVVADDPLQTRKCLAIAAGHVRRLEEMLTDLLDLSRVETPDLKPELARVRPDELFATVRSAVGAMAQKKLVELNFERAPDCPESFVSDKRLLGLVMRNLVENAVKFTPAGGKVSVRLTQGDEQPGGIEVQVIDTGIGIPPEHRERVFERFYQVDAARSSAAGRGTGLGLAIVKHAMHALGGTVELRSEVGAGTTVVCHFPAAARVEMLSSDAGRSDRAEAPSVVE